MNLFATFSTATSIVFVGRKNNKADRTPLLENNNILTGTYMIEYIKGSVEELTPAVVTIEANGVGYGMFISLNTYTAIQGKKEAKLYVHEAIREDAHQLYGFAEKEERAIFLQLIGVPGIGGQMARMVLSSFSPQELAHIINEGNARMLKSVKGIGPKVAQRIIVDLKDKILCSQGQAGRDTTNAVPSSQSTSAGVADEAIAALSMLGFAPAASQKVVLDLIRQHPESPVELIIKLALKSL